MTATLECSNLPWETILEQVAGPVVVVDRQGRFVYVNPAFYQLLGYRPPDLLRHIPREFTHPEDFAEEQDTIDCAIQHSEDSFEVENASCTRMTRRSEGW